MQTATSAYTVTSKAKTTLFGEEYAPMKDSLTCPHCGSDSVSHDATAAQQRIQELEAQLRIYSEKASETGMSFSLNITKVKYTNVMRSGEISRLRK
jgi:transcription elongation factor Elf1